jgi:hypothetical protein
MNWKRALANGEGCSPDILTGSRKGFSSVRTLRSLIDTDFAYLARFVRPLAQFSLVSRTILCDTDGMKSPLHECTTLEKRSVRRVVFLVLPSVQLLDLAGPAQVFDTMPRWKSILVLVLCPSFGSIMLIPQGLVPLFIKLSGSSSRGWFLALYLPTAWQWPVIILMLLLGSTILEAMVLLYLTHKKVWQRLQTANSSSQL